MAELYTQTDVNNVLLRAQVAMELTSQRIGSEFMYFNTQVYNTFKDLQYDIYTLFNVITNENPFVTYASTPSTYEGKFYKLVGALINKLRFVDNMGAFSGGINPNYQSPNITLSITSTGSTPERLVFDQSNLIDADPPNGNWYLPYAGSKTPIELLINDVQTGAVQIDYSFTPARIYGFASNATQTIQLTVI